MDKLEEGWPHSLPAYRKAAAMKQDILNCVKPAHEDMEPTDRIQATYNAVHEALRYYGATRAEQSAVLSLIHHESMVEAVKAMDALGKQHKEHKVPHG